MNILVRNNAVQEKQYALVQFGLEQGIVTLFEIALMLFSGLIIGVFWESIIILISFAPVRVYAGGYHAKTQGQCIVKSLLLFIAIQLCFKHIYMGNMVQVIIMIIVGILIFCCCPIQAKNKQLKDWEIVKYRNKCRKAYIINMFVFTFGYVINISILSKCIVHGMLMVGIMIILSEINSKTE